MYSVLYLYPVPKENTDAFLEAEREASSLYLQHGALECQTLIASDLTAQYGCRAFGEAVVLRPDETLLVGISHFRSFGHHNEVMEKVDADARILELYDEVKGLLELHRVIRGEFGRAV